MVLRTLLKTKVISNIFYFVLLLPLLFYYRFLCRCSFEGELNIIDNLDNGFIVAANHSSYLDWIVLNLNFIYKLNLTVGFLAKAKVLNHHLWGPIAAKCNCIKVGSDGRIASSDNNKKNLLSHKYIVIFPEGTRTPQGKLIKAKTGVAKISNQQGLPVIPTGLIGFFDAWPRHKIFPRSHKLIIRFGKPYYPVLEEINKQTLERETRKIMLSIGELIGKDYPF